MGATIKLQQGSRAQPLRQRAVARELECVEQAIKSSLAHVVDFLQGLRMRHCPQQTLPAILFRAMRRLHATLESAAGGDRRALVACASLLNRKSCQLAKAKTFFWVISEWVNVSRDRADFWFYLFPKGPKSGF